MKLTIFVLLIALTSQQQEPSGYQLSLQRNPNGGLSRESSLNNVPSYLIEKGLMKRGGININRSGSLGYPDGGDKMNYKRQFNMERQGSSFILPNKMGYGLDIDRNDGLSVNGSLNFESRDRDNLMGKVRDGARRKYQSAVKTMSTFPQYTKEYLNDKYDLAGKFVNERRDDFRGMVDNVQDKFDEWDLRNDDDNNYRQERSAPYVQRRGERFNDSRQIYNTDIKRNNDRILNDNYNQDIGREDESIPKKIQLLEELQNLEKSGFRSEKYEDILARELEIKDFDGSENLYKNMSNRFINPNVENQYEYENENPRDYEMSNTRRSLRSFRNRLRNRIQN